MSAQHEHQHLSQHDQNLHDFHDNLDHIVSPRIYVIVGATLLIFTGITSKAPATIRGLRPAMLPGQRVSAWLEMDVKANAVARRTQREVRSDWDFMSASARGVRAEADIGGYIWLPQWIRGKMRVNAIWKRC